MVRSAPRVPPDLPDPPDRPKSVHRRSLLRAQLAESWDRTVIGPYVDQLINSERGLQVHFCLELMRGFEASRLPRRLFVEPTLTFDDGVRRSPDLLVCTARQVIAAIEFKYTPRARPAQAKDLDTLARIAEVGTGVTVANERFRGEGRPRRYAVAADAVMAWAAVHPGPTLGTADGMPAGRGGRWLCLEAITAADAPPTVLINGRRRRGGYGQSA